MDESRKYDRRHLIYYLNVFKKSGRKPLGQLVDISEEGIKMVSEKKMKTGEEFFMRLVLPDGYPRKELIFAVECRWSGRDVNPDYFVSGFLLHDVSREDTDLIHRLIDEVGFNS